MKRHGNLWPELLSFPNLVRAVQNAARRKRSRGDVAAFLFDQEKHLCDLQAELTAKTYRPGPYRTFFIFEPKKRLIGAAPFRDRVVHHALCRVLEPIYERVFIHDTYACRKGKGAHAAVERFTHYARRHRYVLKCDVAKYFPSIDHAILKQTIARKIKDKEVLWLANLIIDHSNLQEAVFHLHRGDDLFTLLERRRGLPLGNQTSQFFANVYLDPFDHFVREVLRAPGYVRYVDNFVIFHDDQAWLAQARAQCREYLAGLRLRLHPEKSVISRVKDGTRFLGYRNFPDHRLLPKTNVVRFKRRMRDLQSAYARYECDGDDVQRSIAGWLGHAGQADTWHLRERLLNNTIFQRGDNRPSGERVEGPRGAGRLVQQQSEELPFRLPQQQFAR